jgi:ribosomal protein S18 acetylase RimI-like enzyme
VTADADFVITRLRRGDEEALAEVCLQTGQQGNDASGLYVDDDLLPDMYVRPYLELEPSLVSVLRKGARVCGYLVAAADTSEFVRAYQGRWLPKLTARYGSAADIPEPSGSLVARALAPESMLPSPDILQRYPAHLHINLVAEARGRGFGNSLMQRLFSQLRRALVPGVHLSYGTQNVGAGHFYARLGFEELRRGRASVLLGQRVSPLRDEPPVSASVNGGEN